MPTFNPGSLPSNSPCCFLGARPGECGVHPSQHTLQSRPRPSADWHFPFHAVTPVQIPGDPFSSLSSLLKRERWADRLLFPCSLKTSQTKQSRRPGCLSFEWWRPRALGIVPLVEASIRQAKGESWSRTGCRQLQEGDVSVVATFNFMCSSHSSTAVACGVGGGSLVECRASRICY